MKVVTGEQMKAIDRLAREAGVTTLALMENAGGAVFEQACRLLPPDISKVVVICGKGNNGGDGLVAARLLKERGVHVKVLLAAKAQDLQGEPKENLERALAAGVPIEEKADEEKVLIQGRGADLIIDALFGTGIKGPVTATAAEIIRAINRAKRPVLAVDIPSGVDADTGEVAGPAVQADYTVTMALPKFGLLVYPGADYTGYLTIADIGMPASAINAVATKIECLDSAEVAQLLPRRHADSHKGDYGRVLVVAGSVGFTGAAALCCLGALRAGAGLVTLAIPASLNDIMEIKLTEVITRPMPETDSRTLSLEATHAILDLAAKSDVVALGPGLSLEPETAHLVRELVGRITRPLVLDADALTILSEDITILEKAYAKIVCTPHPGEMARLVGISTSQVQKSRAVLCRRLAGSIGGVVVLKGAATLICNCDEHLRINTSGNAGMATGGTGDVLTGMIAGLIGQGMNTFNAASAAVYLHGLAGDLAAVDKGEMGLIATDLLEKVPAATLQVLSSNGVKAPGLRSFSEGA